MNLCLFRALPALLIALVTLSFSSCSSLTNGMPAPLTEALGEVTGFSSEIGDWQAQLGGMLDGTALDQLKGYADKATDLGSSLGNLTSGLSDAMADPIGAISTKLTDMGSLKIDSLKEMLPADQMQAVEGFASSASDVGSLADDFMKQFGGR